MHKSKTFIILFISAIFFTHLLIQTNIFQKHTYTTPPLLSDPYQPSNTPRLNGYINIEDGSLNNFQNRLYITGENTYYLIENNGDLVRWGTNFDQHDIGWPNDYPQPFDARSTLIQNITQFNWGYGTYVAIDNNNTLWGWGPQTWHLLDNNITNTKQPKEILASVQNIALGDFYAAVVLTDGSLQIWGNQDGYNCPQTIQTNVKKVCIIRDCLFYLDTNGNLFSYDQGNSHNLSGFLTAPLILGSNIQDIQILNYQHLFVLKDNFCAEILDFATGHIISIPVATDVCQICTSGYYSSGVFHHVTVKDSDIVSHAEPQVVYATYNVTGDYAKLLCNGIIDVGFSEDSLMTQYYS